MTSSFENIRLTSSFEDILLKSSFEDIREKPLDVGDPVREVRIGLSLIIMNVLCFDLNISFNSKVIILN